MEEIKEFCSRFRYIQISEYQAKKLADHFGQQLEGKTPIGNWLVLVPNEAGWAICQDDGMTPKGFAMGLGLLAEVCW